MKVESDKQVTGKGMMTFTHAAGGMGATTLAVNAAAVINAAVGVEKKNVCLLDLDMQFGGASIQLDLSGYSPLLDLMGSPERLDASMLEGLMVPHKNGLRVLTTPEMPLPLDGFSPAIIERLLQVAMERYAYVVVDMPQTITQWTDTVFKKSTVIYVVTEMDVPSIRQLKRWFAVLEQEGLAALPIKVVVNRYNAFGHVGQSNVTLAQASEALGKKIDFTVSNDHDLISQSLDEGIPAADLSPSGRFSQQIKNMLHSVVDEIEPPHERSFLGWKF